MNRILITGVNGLVGKDVYKVFRDAGFALYGIGRAEPIVMKSGYYRVDLTDSDSVIKTINEIKPNAIVHLAAYTKLDDCENNKEYAYKMNVEVTRLLAQLSPYFIYMSSDAVFDGNVGSPYTEESECHPVNFYGQTKYEGEIEALKTDNALVIRSSIYGFNINGNSSVAEWGIKNLLQDREITGFDDVIFNPLYSLQLARIILSMVKSQTTGVYHLGADTAVSKYDFFRMIAGKLGKNTELVKKGSVSDMKFNAERTKDTTLSISKFKSNFNFYDEINLEYGMDRLIKDMSKRL